MDSQTAFDLCKKYDAETVEKFSLINPEMKPRNGSRAESLRGASIEYTQHSGLKTRADTKYCGLQGEEFCFEAWKICHDESYAATQLWAFTADGRWFIYDIPKLKKWLLERESEWAPGPEPKTNGHPNLLYKPASFTDAPCTEKYNMLNSYRGPESI